jgi:predicted ABC-type transport system involved in lysophospholipase L1 biosynthesis ATPase subunit
LTWPSRTATGWPARGRPTRDEIMTLLERLWREHGLTLVIVTHDSSVAHRAQRIGLMRNGRIEVRPTAPTLRGDRA